MSSGMVPESQSSPGTRVGYAQSRSDPIFPSKDDLCDG